VEREIPFLLSGSKVGRRTLFASLMWEEDATFIISLEFVLFENVRLVYPTTQALEFIQLLSEKQKHQNVCHTLAFLTDCIYSFASVASESQAYQSSFSMRYFATSRLLSIFIKFNLRNSIPVTCFLAP